MTTGYDSVVELSSEEAGRIAFSGTEESYDRVEVEEFRQRVVAALAAYEAGTGTAGDGELAEAQRVRQQAVHLAERMLRDVMGSPGDAAGGLETWQEAALLQARAEEAMEFAREESRRLPAMAAAERDEMRARYAKERNDVRAELQKEMQDSRAAVDEDAKRIRLAAESEAANILDAAVGEVEQARRAARADLHRVERRLALLHKALADAESRFRRLAATAANEAGTLAALASQDADEASGEQSEMELTVVDLTSQDLRESDDGAAPTGGGSPVERTEEPGFYQRRLAGLRDRLEKSGHPPE